MKTHRDSEGQIKWNQWCHGFLKHRGPQPWSLWPIHMFWRCPFFNTPKLPAGNVFKFSRILSMMHSVQSGLLKQGKHLKHSEQWITKDQGWRSLLLDASYIYSSSGMTTCFLPWTLASFALSQNVPMLWLYNTLSTEVNTVSWVCGNSLHIRFSFKWTGRNSTITLKGIRVCYFRSKIPTFSSSYLYIQIMLDTLCWKWKPQIFFCWLLKTEHDH